MSFGRLGNLGRGFGTLGSNPLGGSSTPPTPPAVALKADGTDINANETWVFW